MVQIVLGLRMVRGPRPRRHLRTYGPSPNSCWLSVRFPSFPVS